MLTADECARRALGAVENCDRDFRVAGKLTSGRLAMSDHTEDPVVSSKRHGMCPGRALLLGSLMAAAGLFSSAAVAGDEEDMEYDRSNGPMVQTAEGPVIGLERDGVY